MTGVVVGVELEEIEVGFGAVVEETGVHTPLLFLTDQAPHPPGGVLVVHDEPVVYIPLL